jgi:transketolase
MKAQRDIFIQSLYEKALLDKDIIIISVDMGAPNLDQWKANLPNQFIAAGISEQNAINLAAGLANSGKKVFVYFMASWFSRCIEQIRYSCAMANNSITILGNGVALGYAPSGPAHQPNEDIALSRALLNIEVFSPANESATSELVDLCLSSPKLRYIRLERSYAKEVIDVIYDCKNTVQVIKQNYLESNVKVALISSGYMLGRVSKVYDELCTNYNVKLIDLWRIKPLDSESLYRQIFDCTHIITIEEQSLSGGFSSAICEFLFDNNLKPCVKRFGLPENYIFENGTRDHLIDTNNLSFDNILKQSIEFINNVEK